MGPERRRRSRVPGIRRWAFGDKKPLEVLVKTIDYDGFR